MIAASMIFIHIRYAWGTDYSYFAIKENINKGDIFLYTNSPNAIERKSQVFFARYLNCKFYYKPVRDKFYKKEWIENYNNTIIKYLNKKYGNDWKKTFDEKIKAVTPYFKPVYSITAKHDKYSWQWIALVDADNKKELKLEFQKDKNDAKIVKEFRIRENDHNYKNPSIPIEKTPPVLYQLLINATDKVNLDLHYTMAPDIYSDTTLCKRFCLSIINSEEWKKDKTLGIKKNMKWSYSTVLRPFLAKNIQAGHVFKEIEEILRLFDYEIETISTEKELSIKAGELPFYDELKKYNVALEDKIPIPGMVYIYLKKKNQYLPS